VTARVLFKRAASPPREVAARTFRFVASTGTLDRDGDILDPDGWRLDAFRRNPVILVAHESRSLPVARAAYVGVVDGQLVLDVEFPPAGTTRVADEVFNLVREGFLRAVSVGFVPDDWEPLVGGGRRYTSMELLEVSLVPIPANPEALLAAAFGGKSRATEERLRRSIRAAVGAAVSSPAVRRAIASLAAELSWAAGRLAILRAVSQLEAVRRRLAVIRDRAA
jgi:HK97 family phage prohead protease